jgi:hypothetical protein
MTALDTTTPATAKFQTREAWLRRAVERLTPMLADAGETVPDLRISVGWPGGRGNKQHVIGQCWYPETVRDSTFAIFVSPVLEEPEAVLETVLHELVHAVGHRGHRGGFARTAAQLGFTAPWTATPASAPLKERLTRVASRLGAFPHARVSTIGAGLTLGGTLTAPPVQSTRMLKVMCEADGYTARLTMKWLAEGAPLCGMCGELMVWQAAS